MRRRWLIPLAATAALAYAGYRYEHGLAHGLGIDTQASQNYDFVSGVGPMIIAALGYAGLIASVVHHLNCHQPGCWRIGRHRIGTGVWCGRHHEGARPAETEMDLLREIRDYLESIVPREWLTREARQDRDDRRERK